MPSLRWGLVGTGTWARTVHAPSLATAAGGGRLTAVWGRDPDRAGALAAEHGAATATSFDHLLDAVDAVCLAVAPDAQVALARRAVERGLPLLLEKPVATEAAAVQDLVRVMPGGSRAVVFLTRLFEPARSRWVREAARGSWTRAEVVHASGALTAGSAYAGSLWRHGAGGLWDLLPHVLSQVVPVLGDVADGTVVPWPDHDGFLVDLAHVGGATTRVRISLTAAPEDREEWIRFDGPGGSTRSPARALDFVAAHAAAVQVVEGATDPRHDPLLRMTTVEAALAPTALIADLVAQHEGRRMPADDTPPTVRQT
ncbi:Gfo/Idh/MocA family oxidoreductase [Angustibacter speluncae]